MTAEVEYVAARIGAARAGAPFRVCLDAPGADVLLALPRAIYLAYTRDGQLHYIGKVDRKVTRAMAARLREHTRGSRRKRSAWRWLWVVPLATTMPAAELLGLERTLICVYQPPGNVQHARAAS